ncbi:tetratricopeptide repeat protein [Citreimonas sp.]|uniref:tetratricopeptide repeat protein n=1 Tax=Citreimonas sp. TaxID=3036715 RepID=UPI0040592FDE
MSNPDSFIDEVTEEVRRDRLFGYMRRYGWIAIVIVVVIVAGAAWNEWSKAREAAQAQAFGDAILAALEAEEAEGRVEALDAIAAPGPGGAAVLGLFMAAEAGRAEDDATAVARLQTVADNSEIPLIYRQIAQYKALSRGAGVMDPEQRRAGLEALAVPGQPLRLLAEEQLALIEIEQGDTDAAIERLRRVIDDSEATAGLRRRASRLIVALGGSLTQAG